LNRLSDTENNPETHEVGERRKPSEVAVRAKEVGVGAHRKDGEGGAEEGTDGKHALVLIVFVAKVSHDHAEHGEDA
jgi:hypothetical protein